MWLMTHPILHAAYKTLNNHQTASAFTFSTWNVARRPRRDCPVVLDVTRTVVRRHWVVVNHRSTGIRPLNKLHISSSLYVTHARRHTDEISLTMTSRAFYELGNVLTSEPSKCLRRFLFFLLITAKHTECRCTQNIAWNFRKLQPDHHMRSRDDVGWRDRGTSKVAHRWHMSVILTD